MCALKIPKWLRTHAAALGGFALLSCAPQPPMVDAGNAEDAGSIWTAVELPHGPPRSVDVTSANGVVHFLYILVRHDPTRYETCHWPMGGESTCIDVFESTWGAGFENPSRSYSAIAGVAMISSVVGPERVNIHTRAWSVRAPLALKPVYVCQDLAQAVPAVGMIAGETPWVQRSASYSCTEPGPPLRHERCPGGGLALFLAGEAGIMCPFADAALGRLTASEGIGADATVMHPYLPVAGINQMEFFSFDRDGGLGEFSYMDAGPSDLYGRQYRWHQFWPTADLPVRRVGLDGRGRFEALIWVDGGIEIVAMPHLQGKFGQFREIVETSRGIVLVGEPPWPDGGGNDSYRRYVLVSRDGRDVLGEYQLRTDSAQRIIETDAGIFVFRMRFRVGDNGREFSVEYTQLPFSN